MNVDATFKCHQISFEAIELISIATKIHIGSLKKSS
jgi:hypothetical protein